MAWKDEYTQLLKKYSKAIVHLRYQHNSRRLSLMLGAGVSKELGVPNWEDLVKNIAKELNGEKLLESQCQRSSITSKVQILMELFQRTVPISGTTPPKKEDLLFLDPRIKKQWHDFVRKKLYENLKIKTESIRSFHPYLGTYIDIIRNSPITINYNFDDFIERMLAEINDEQGHPINEGYESVWDINLQFKSNASIIYHPNGYLPRNRLEKSSDWLVFCDDEYADQLIYSMTGYLASLAHHLSKNTCLLMGLSLEDSTLKHILRQNAKINPGHYHYYVAWVKDGQTITQEEQEAISLANFEVYNLITLFLKNSEIRTLGELINMKNDDFQYNSIDNKCTIKYCYYITGAIGAGKSTAVSHFGSLQTHDEWPERRLEELAKYSGSLKPEEKEKTDNWLASQFARKNWDLCTSTEGIHVIDRSPLDPLGFTEDADWQNKAELLHQKICKEKNLKIEPGVVFLLFADPNVLVTRTKPAQSEYTPDHLKEQQVRLAKAYDLPEGIIKINTTGKSTNDVAKAIAKIIYISHDQPTAKLHERLEKIKEKGIK